MKRVHFATNEPLKCRRIYIPFNPKIRLNLSIEATPQELDSLSHYINKLHTIHIKLTPSDEHTIKQFINEIRQILELNCIARHKDFIKTSVRYFFSDLIHQIPDHSIPPGWPGYTHHVKELEHMDKVIKIINLELNKIDVISMQSMLASQPSFDEEEDGYSFDSLPENLPAFIQSIDVTVPGSVALWLQRFETHTPHVLSSYLSQVTTSMQQITESDEIYPLIDTIYQFMRQLPHDRFILQREMFSDVAIHGNRSPLRSPHKEHENILKEHENILKYQLDALLEPQNPHFSRDFLLFRQELTRSKNAPHVRLDRLLQSLHHYLFEKNLSYPSTQTTLVQDYICQCLNRIEQPFPKHLQLKIDALLLNYDDENNRPFSRRKRSKFDFLTSLSDNIRIHPEKTYAECYRLTTSVSEAGIRALVAEKSWTFFARHRFKNFIRELLDEEPDYDVTLNNLTHDDVGCFPC